MATPSPSQQPPESTPMDTLPENLGQELADAAVESNLPKAVSSFISARIELASIEAREAAEYAGSKAVHGAILAVCAFFAWGLFLAALTGALAPIADQWLEGKVDNLPGWAAILFIFAIIHGLGALIFLGQLKKKPSSPLFDLSRKEIENDKQWLRKNK